MELGATVCLRQNPGCAACPVASFCTARSTGQPEKYPRLTPKQTEKRSVKRIWCEHAGRLLLRRGHARARRLAGMYELPEAADLGLQPAVKSLLAVRRRAITRFQITESIHAFKPSAALRKLIQKNSALVWMSVRHLDRITLSGPHRRWIREILDR